MRVIISGVIVHSSPSQSINRCPRSSPGKAFGRGEIHLFVKPPFSPTTIILECHTAIATATATAIIAVLTARTRRQAAVLEAVDAVEIAETMWTLPECQ